MEHIATDKAPAALGTYSQAVVLRDQGLVFTAGQLGVDPATGEFAGPDIDSQTHQCLQNIRAILNAAGTDLQHVVKATVFLSSINNFASMNEIYAQYFPEQPPARTALEVSRLPKGALIEIEAIATLGT